MFDFFVKGYNNTLSFKVKVDFKGHASPLSNNHLNCDTMENP